MNRFHGPKLNTPRFNLGNVKNLKHSTFSDEFEFLFKIKIRSMGVVIGILR